MAYTLIASRGTLLAIVVLGFLCSLAIGAEFELISAMEPASGHSKRQRLEFEELTALSAVFSLLFALVAALSRKSALRERRARRLAETVALLDPLTGLGNRRLFNERLETALADYRGKGVPCALLLIDLDRFKQTNDTYGHAAGDRLLVEIGHLLRSIAPSAEDAARLGGDEFALILAGEEASEAKAQATAAEIRRSIGRPIRHDAQWLSPSASVGIAWARPGASRAADLLEAADQKLYRAKRCRGETAAA